MNSNRKQTPIVMHRIRLTAVSIFAAVAWSAFFPASSAQAAPIEVLHIGAAASQFGTNVNTLTNFTVVAGNSRLLVVGVGDSHSLDIMTVTFNGTALTQIVETNDNFAVDSLWYLALGTSASATNGNIVITHDIGDREFISAIAFENVDQSSPVSSALALRGNASPASLNVSSQAGDLVLDLIDVYRSSALPVVTPVSGQTVFASQSGALGEGFGNYRMSTQPGEATTLMSWTHNGDAVIQLAVNIKLASSDAIAPTITSIVRKTPAQQTVATNAVVFAVTFSENVTGVVPARFAVTPVNGSTVTGAVGSISGGPQTYDVLVNITGGTGEFRLDVPTDL